MRKQPSNHYSAFKQLLILFTIVSWIAFAYFFITGESKTFFHVNGYGLQSHGILNGFTSLLTVVFFSILFLIAYFPSKKKD
jgi:energy-coupling factor transporter transmembrane protein EcfT